MILKTLRIAALAAVFAGSAVAAQAAETGMMDKPMTGSNKTMTSPGTGGPIQKAGAKKHGAMMNHKTPKKHAMRHGKPMSGKSMSGKGTMSGPGDMKGAPAKGAM